MEAVTYRRTVNMHTKNIDSVFFAKGIGIILVAIGHYSPESSPQYWTQMRNIIYTFHMPLFFMLAGYLYGLSRPETSNYIDFIHNKAKRLLIPFMSIAALVLMIKFLAASFFTLAHPVTLDTIIAIFVYPQKSFLVLLWFIYALFIVFTLFPVINTLIKQNATLLVFVLVSLYYIEWTNYFCLAKVFQHLPVFGIGYILGNRDINIDKIDKRFAFAIFAFFTFLFIVIYTYKDISFDSIVLQRTARLILAICGSVSCMAISIFACNFNNLFVSFVKLAGIYSMSIYLLHTVFAGVIRIGFYQVLKMPDSKFIFGAIAGIAVGIIAPLLLERFILSKYVFTKRFFLGLG